jgi:Tol biopolymer transport system component
VGTAYRVWNGDMLSPARDGEPVAWSSDGRLLAGLVPLSGSQGNLPEGTLSIVDQSGSMKVQMPEWIGDTYGQYAFSPDGRYLAACLRGNNTGELQAMRVVDIQAESVSGPVGNCGYLSWSSDDTLYSSDGTTAPRMWTSSMGAATVGLPANSVIFVSPSGSSAEWSDSSPELNIVTGSEMSTYQASGNIQGLSWSPDGSAIAVTSLTSDGATDVLTIVRIAARI